MLKTFLLAFVPIFVAVDAIGNMPIYLALTDGMPSSEKKRLVWNSILTALFVAVAFLWVGQVLFALLGITINDFLVAGGVILFVISIRHILSDDRGPKLPVTTPGVVPLAVPLIVGPAVLTTSLILLNSLGFAWTVLSIVLNLLLCGVLLHISGTVARFFGRAGMHTLAKIMGLLLAAIGVMMVRRGLGGVLS